MIAIALRLQTQACVFHISDRLKNAASVRARDGAYLLAQLDCSTHFCNCFTLDFDPPEGSAQEKTLDKHFRLRYIWN